MNDNELTGAIPKRTCTSPILGVGWRRSLLPPDEAARVEVRSMRKNTIFPTHFQVCAICGKRHEITYKFPFLKDYGIKGKYAALDCLGKLPRPDLTNVTFLVGRRRAPAAEEE